jgi:TctA family transporter
MIQGIVPRPMPEEDLRCAMSPGRGDPRVFVTRPISAVILALSVAILVVMLLPLVRKTREDVFVEHS